MHCLVLKFGTGVLASVGGCSIDHTQFERIAKEVGSLIKQGIPCILVTSAAVAAGIDSLGLPERPTDQATKQACAAVGQPALMATYAHYFKQEGIITAQVLLTHDDIFNAERKKNAQATLERLLRVKHLLPIINENDTVAVEELKLGDNDRLSAHVAMMMKAEKLLLFTSANGLLSKGEKEEKRISLVSDLESVMRYVTEEKGLHSTGGMRSKLEAVQLATEAGIETFILDGRQAGALAGVLNNEDIGTRFLAKKSLFK